MSAYRSEDHLEQVLSRLAQVVNDENNISPRTLRSAGYGANDRAFWKGVLAHLILVPNWTIPPVVLFGGSVLAGAGHGPNGVIAGLALAMALVGDVLGPSTKARSLLCTAMGVLATTSRRIKSIFGAGLVSFMVWLLTRQKPLPRHQRLHDYVSRWAPDFYRQAELRGAVRDIRKGRSLFAFHPHGCLCAGFTINGTFNPDFMQYAGKVCWLYRPTLKSGQSGFRCLCDAYEPEEHAIEECSSRNIQVHMARGDSIAFIPGGLLDAVVSHYGKERCVLNDQQAFIKLSLQYGYRVHPVYTFGESETYTTFTGFIQLRLKIAKCCIPAFVFFGWPLLPLLPRPQSRIITYVRKATVLFGASKCFGFISLVVGPAHG